MIHQNNPLGAIPSFFTRRTEAQGMMPASLPPAVQELLEKPLSWFEELGAMEAPKGTPLVTHVAFALDKSSSMSQGKRLTIEGFNSQLKQVQEGAAQVGQTYMTVAQFSTNVELGQVAVPVDQVVPLNEQTYQPAGWTALYDAIGETLAALLALPDIHQPNCATLVNIFTDGEENQSRTYSAAVLRQMIERLEKTKRWTFALVAPKNGVASLAQILSVDKTNIAGFDPGSLESRKGIMGAMSLASSSYMCARANGMTQVQSLYAGPNADKSS